MPESNLFTMSRPSDPQTSHDAARRVVKTGTRNKHYRTIMQAVCQHPGATPPELARLSGLRHDQVWRRLSEMDHKLHWITRRGRRDGHRCVWPTPLGEHHA